MSNVTLLYVFCDSFVCVVWLIHMCNLTELIHICYDTSDAGVECVVCCSVLQYVAVCCSVLQRVAVCCSVMQCSYMS